MDSGSPTLSHMIVRMSLLWATPVYMMRYIWVAPTCAQALTYYHKLA